MEISAKVIADSVWGEGHRLTTLQLRYPRQILPELDTHRVFSRNSSSSRAIPIKKKLDLVRTDPFLPKFLLQNKKGMQGGDVLDDDSRERALLLIQHLKDYAVDVVEELADIGLAKQAGNRYLEPWDWTDTVVSSTDWANFFSLRIHEAAEPHMRALAEAMLAAIRESTPTAKTAGEWHLPYLDPSSASFSFSNAPMRSSARCARVSYSNHDGSSPSLVQDMDLYDKLTQDPVHGSALEHAARVPYANELMMETWRDVSDFPKSRLSLIPELRSNFHLWVQHRKLVPGENNSTYHEFKR